MYLFNVQVILLDHCIKIYPLPINSLCNKTITKYLFIQVNNNYYYTIQRNKFADFNVFLFLKLWQKESCT